MTPEQIAELMALADRVEALTGPCRETDAQIALALNMYDRPEDLGCFVDLAKAVVGGGGHTWAPPCYTASLDAAMALAEDEMQPDVLRDAIVKLSVEGWLPGRYAETLTRYVVEAALRAKAAS